MYVENEITHLLFFDVDNGYDNLYIVFFDDIADCS